MGPKSMVNNLKHDLFENAFDCYRSSTGAVADPTAKLLRNASAQHADRDLKSPFFTIGNRSSELTANAQLWPRALNELIGGKRGHI
jgi:hypothetical protein